MATDGPTPPPCDPEIFAKGECVLHVTGSSNAIERWVKKVAAEAKARVDWHYAGGVANILHLGDAESKKRTLSAIEKLLPDLQGRVCGPGEVIRFY